MSIAERLLEKKGDGYLGVSTAASWTWGVSVMVGMAILKDRGWIAWTIWATFNALALPLFGLGYHKLKILFEYIDKPVLKPFLGGIQIFSMWINMQAIFLAAQWFGMGDQAAMLMMVGVGVVWVVVFTFGGLAWSVFTDSWQWAVIYVGVVVMLVSDYVVLDPQFAAIGKGLGEIDWAVWGGIGLLAGPFLDMQQWQRADRLRGKRDDWRAYRIGGALFAVYMVGIGALGVLEQSMISGMILLIVVLAVSTSTIDSAVAAQQRIAGKRWGFVVMMAAAVSWPLLREMNITTMWMLYASSRVFIVAAMLVVAYIHQRQRGRASLGRAAG